MAKTKIKKKVKAKEKEKFKVYLLYESDSYGGEVCEGEEKDPYPCHEPEHHTFMATGLRLEAPEWSETIEVDFDPAKSEYLYVVVVRYSSGSTFGTSHGHWCIEGAFKTYAKAEKMKKSIEDGTYFGKYHEWEGYFESLEGVTVERLDIWK